MPRHFCDTLGGACIDLQRQVSVMPEKKRSFTFPLSTSREGVPPFFGKPNTHNMCQNNTIAIMPTNNNNTDNNKGKEVEKQANRRSRGSVGREILLETLSLLMERRTD